MTYVGLAVATVTQHQCERSKAEVHVIVFGNKK